MQIDMHCSPLYKKKIDLSPSEQVDLFLLPISSSVSYFGRTNSNVSVTRTYCAPAMRPTGFSPAVSILPLL